MALGNDDEDAADAAADGGTSKTAGAGADAGSGKAHTTHCPDYGGTGCLYKLSEETRAHIKHDTGLNDKGLDMLVSRSPTPQYCWIVSNAAQALGSRAGVRTVGGGVPALRMHIPHLGAQGEWRLCQEGIRTLSLLLNHTRLPDTLFCQ